MIGFGWCNTLPLVHGQTTPNMIVFIADDVSWNDFGCYGNKSNSLIIGTKRNIL